MNFSKIAIAAAFSMFAFAAHAASELVTNGSFEAYSGPSFGSYKTINAGSGVLTGWAVGGISVDLINGNFGAISGNSVDMLGSPGPGSLSQTLATVVGETYLLQFDLSQNTGGDMTAAAKTLNVSFNGGAATGFVADYSGARVIDHETLTFVASSSSTLLTFTSGTSGAWGAVLDNVSVTAVPEPETYAMLLAGLGMIGAIVGRRQRRYF